MKFPALGIASLVLVASCGVLLASCSDAPEDAGGGQGGAEGEYESPEPPPVVVHSIGSVVDAPAHADCNFSGAWLLETTITSVANDDDQVARRVYFYEVSQEGEDFEIVTAYNCGVTVETSPFEGTGRTRVTLTDDSLEGLASRVTHAGTRGTFVSDGGECAFTMDRVYEVRGADPEVYLPADAALRPNLGDLTPLPTDGRDETVSDWSQSGSPGLRWDIDTSIGEGWRSSAQRDYQDFFSVAGDSEFSVPLGATEFVVRADVALEEVVYDASNAIFETLAELDPNQPHTARFRRLGSSLAEVGELPTPADSGDELVAFCRALEGLRATSP